MGLRNKGWGLLFDQLKDKEGWVSDAKLANEFGVSRGYICGIRKDRNSVSREFGEMIFKRLGRRVTEQERELLLPRKVQIAVNARRISPKLRLSILRRADGHCELCDNPAPFTGPDGNPYLELHHIVQPLCGGKNSSSNVAALCPNCHRRVELCPSEADITILSERVRKKPDSSSKGRFKR